MIFFEMCARLRARAHVGPMTLHQNIYIYRIVTRSSHSAINIGCKEMAIFFLQHTYTHIGLYLCMCHCFLILYYLVSIDVLYRSLFLFEAMLVVCSILIT